VAFRAEAPAPVELDKLSDDARLAEHLRDTEHEIRRGRALRQLSGEMNADDIRRQEVNRLAEHPGFRLNSADAPADDSKTVDHRRVRIVPTSESGK
jgi:hypothetical protein